MSDSQSQCPVSRRQRNEQLPLLDDYDGEPRVAEFVAFQAEASLLISGRWTRNINENVLTFRRTELSWDYSKDRFNEYSYSYEIPLRNDGQTVDHTGKNWIKHARDAIEKTAELRPRVDSVIRVADPEANSITQWVDEDVEFNSLSAALNFIYLLE